MSRTISFWYLMDLILMGILLKSVRWSVMRLKIIWLPEGVLPMDGH